MTRMLNLTYKLLKTGGLWLLLEPPGSGPLLHLLLAATADVVLVGEGLQPGIEIVIYLARTPVVFTWSSTC